MRFQRKMAIVLFCFYVIFLSVIPVTGYDTNFTGPNQQHQEINRQAILLVEQWMKKDPVMKYAEFSSETMYGNKLDNSEGYGTAKDWITYGGYAEDWEGWGGSRSALRHFYDPSTGQGLSNIPVDVITSIDMFGFVSVPATTWATSPENSYTFEKAHSYYTLAMGSRVYRDKRYGNTWRSLGQTMHLVSDMTVPAHVRNDMHIPDSVYIVNDPDPYEIATTTGSITEYANPAQASKSINFGAFFTDTDIQGLMHRIALWTHDHFYSKDTLPYGGDLDARFVKLNGRSGYVDMNDIKSVPDYSSGHYFTNIDGQEIPAVNVTVYRGMKTNVIQFDAGNGPEVSTFTYDTLFTSQYMIDNTVIKEQQRLLIPNAVTGSAMVLWTFLPRYRVVLDTPVNLPGTNQYKITGSLVFLPTPAWPEEPDVNNGAYIRINDRTPIEIYGQGNGLKKISTWITANPGDKILLYYDFGGYRIKSDTGIVPEIITPEDNSLHPETKPEISTNTTDISQNCLLKFKQLSYVDGKPKKQGELSSNEYKDVIKYYRCYARCLLMDEGSGTCAPDACYCGYDRFEYET